MVKDDKIFLCRSSNKHVPLNRWIVSLSNGETIFEDRIKGLPPAWERLATYVKLNGLKITKMRVQFDGGKLEVSLPPHKEGYIQKKKVGSTGMWTKEQWCVGHLENGKALIHYISADRSSQSKIEDDPGEPWTIYN